MQVTIKLFASFRQKWWKEAVRECPEDALIADIVSTIGIPTTELGIILLNGYHASLNDSLHDGDVISLMPLIGGG